MLAEGGPWATAFATAERLGERHRFVLGFVLGSASMAAPPVLLIDDNQTFGQQVVAAFADVGLQAHWVARAADAIAFLEAERRAGLPTSLLCVVDLVRPASGGRAFLTQLHGPLQVELLAAGCAPTSLALVPVIGSFHDLPDGVEVQVKPIFPSQVVATGRRLLGLAPAVSGRPLSGSLPAIAAGPTTGGPPRLAPPGSAPAVADATIQVDTIEELMDFGPSDTVLMPLTSLGGTTAGAASANMEELARSLSLGGSDPALSAVTSAPDEAAKPAPRPRTRPQFPAISRPNAESSDSPVASVDPSDVHTIPFPRPLPTSFGPGGAGSPAASSDARGGPGLSEIAQASAALLGAGSSPSSRSPSPPAVARSGAVALSGELALIPLIDVVALLAQVRKTGVLSVLGGASGEAPEGASGLRIELYFRGGRLDGAQGHGLPTLRIGRFLLALTGLRGRDLDDAEADRGRSGGDEDSRLLGQRLLRAGLLRGEELSQALAQQCAELLYEALSLSCGRFVFTDCRAEDLPRRMREPVLGGALSLDTEALLLEGYRRMRERLQVGRDIEEGAVYLSLVSGSGPLSRLGLSDVESAVLLLCDGRLSLSEIARESQLALPIVSRALTRLQSLRLCRRRIPALLAG